MTDLIELLRRGDLTGTRDWLVAASPQDRAGVARQVARLRRLFEEHPAGAVAEAWEGELDGHHDAATLAHLACLEPARAATVGAVGAAAARLLPAVHPGALAVLVDTWSTLYQRSPRNWDRNAHYPVIFEWAAQGLVPAPTQDGAVNLWVPFAVLAVHPHDPPGPGEPAGWDVPGPQECPDLYTVTLPRIFDAAVAPGLGAAAHDHGAGDQVIDLVEHLVATGLWDRDDTLARARAARDLREQPFQRRWLSRLTERLTDGRGVAL